MLSNKTDYNPIPLTQPSAFIEMVQTILVSLAITVFIYIFIAMPNQVDGKSMENNFHHGELLITNKIIQLFGGDNILGKAFGYDYARGDVIIFQKPGYPDFIKRIIAGPGDTLKITRDHKIVVNGKILDEDYIPNTDEFITKLPDAELRSISYDEEITLGPDKYFVMGDNREHSQDSRYESVGLIDRDEIKGKVFLKYWPLNEFGIIPRGTYKEEDAGELGD